MQVGDEAEQLGGVLPGDADVVFDDADRQRDPAAGDGGQVGAVRQEIPGPLQGDAVLDPDQDMGAGGQQPCDARDAG